MLHRMALIASLALTFAQPVVAQQDGAANAVQAIQVCVHKLHMYYVPDPEHAEQKRFPAGTYHVAFQADQAGLIRLGNLRVTGQEDANQPHGRAVGRALDRCLRAVQVGAEPAGDAAALQPYVLPIVVVDMREARGQQSNRDYGSSNPELVIMTLLLVTMPAIGALPFAATNR